MPSRPVHQSKSKPRPVKPVADAELTSRPKYVSIPEFGVVVLALALVRLVARQVMGVPALPATMTAREGQLTHLVHWALYGLMFAVPVAGILMSQSGGHDVQVFGLPLPTLLGKDKALHELFEDTHLALAVLLALLVAAHAAAALRHHFVMKDTVLTRMLPW